jgi:hypothetical protein
MIALSRCRIRSCLPGVVLLASAGKSTEIRVDVMADGRIR